jgi:hypothetical protein
MKKGTAVTLVVVVLALALCGGVGFWGYTQLKSGFSLFGSKKAADLGVAWSAADSTAFQQKIGTKAEPLTLEECAKLNITCAQGAVQYSGTKTIDTAITNAEGTALINEWIQVSQNAPFSSAQMRVNQDGTVDFVGVVDMNRVKNFAKVSGVPQSELAAASKFVSVLGSSFPVSASGTLTIRNNQVDANFSSVKVGFLSVPESLFSENKAIIDTFVED